MRRRPQRLFGTPAFGLLSGLLCCLTTGCISLLPPENPPRAERLCAPPAAVSAERPVSTSKLKTEEEIPPHPSLSPQTVKLARIMRVLPMLNELARLHQAGETDSIAYLRLRQELTDRVLLTMFEATSATAEIVCERDRLDQIADRMDEIDSSRVKGLTLASIVLGGVAAIISGGIGLAGGGSTAADVATVTGGVLATVFGGTALFTKSEQDITHERNVLREVWKDPPESTIFSPSTWRFLHRHLKEGMGTPREEMLKAWRQEGRLGEKDSKVEERRIALFFGDGGRYDAADLRARASMLETLESDIRMMDQELELFVRSISNSSNGNN